jgi:hypothetical protein
VAEGGVLAQQIGNLHTKRVTMERVMRAMVRLECNDRRLNPARTFRTVEQASLERRNFPEQTLRNDPAGPENMVKYDNIVNRKGLLIPVRIRVH